MYHPMNPDTDVTYQKVNLVLTSVLSTIIATQGLLKFF